MTPEKYLKSETFQSPIFKIMSELDDPGRLSDLIFVKSLIQVFGEVSPEQIFNQMIMKVMNSCQKNAEFLENGFPVLISALNAALKKKKAMNVLK